MISLRTLLVVGAAMELAFLSFYATDDPHLDVILFIVVNGYCFLLLSYLVFRPSDEPQAQTTPVHQRSVALIIIGFALVFRFTLVFHQPVASDDIFRYLWDGKVAAAGYNPFEYSPLDSQLVHLHTDVLPGLINFPEMRTIYPPLAQLFFRLSNLLWGDSVIGMKLLLVLADLASILIIALLCSPHSVFRVPRSAFRVPPSAFSVPPSAFSFPLSLLLYAWSPLPIMYVALDGHIDGLGIPLLLLFVLLARKGRGILSAIVLGLGALAKLYPLFVAPFLPLFFEGGKRFWLPFVTVALLVLGYLLYVEPSGGVLESLLVYNTRFEFNGAVYTVAKMFLGSAVSHAVNGILLLGWLLFLYLRRLPLAETILLVFLGFLILSPTAHPWYFTWLAALLPLRWSLSTFVLLGLSNLSNIVVYQDRTTGVWEDSPVILFVEYVPFLVLFVREIMNREILYRT